MKPSRDASWAHWTQWPVLNNNQQQIQLRRQQSLFIKPLETAGGALPRHRSNLKGHFTLLYTLINLCQILQSSLVANYNYNCTISPESNRHSLCWQSLKKKKSHPLHPCMALGVTCDSHVFSLLSRLSRLGNPPVASHYHVGSHRTI